MSTAVKRLSDDLINKIAAGEVVERPASVVKELVENSIDAGARNIEVEIRGGGRSLIRVVDDGQGMTEADAQLAIQRHATSKLSAESDLFAIGTLGFRGEALAAISGVSRFELKTHRQGEEVGVRLRCEGGVISQPAPYGGPVGTEIVVRDLFFNTPARLKFMKGPSVEGGHIADMMTRLALANPGVGFKLLRGSERVLQVGPESDGLERAHQILGPKVAEFLYAFKGGRRGVDIHGLLSSPKLSRSGWSAFYAFVNGRALRDRVLMRSVAEAYRAVLPKGRYPVVILHLNMPVQDVDVNVHPGKLEVRFARVRMISEMVVDALRSTLLKTPWQNRGKQEGLPGVRLLGPEKKPHLKQADLAAARKERNLGPLFNPEDALPAVHRAAPAKQPPTPDLEAKESSVKWRLVKSTEGDKGAGDGLPAISRGLAPLQPSPGQKISVDSGMARPAKGAEGGPGEQGLGRVAPKAVEGHGEAASSGQATAPGAGVSGPTLDGAALGGAALALAKGPSSGEKETGPQAETVRSALEPSELQTSPVDSAVKRPLGEIHAISNPPPGLGLPEIEPLGLTLGQTLLGEGAGKFWMVDLHCAREYLCLKALRASEIPERQRLLVPKIIDLPRREAKVLSTQVETLATLGLDVEPFGGLSFAVKSMPKALMHADPEVLLVDLSVQLCKLSASVSPEAGRAALEVTMACHGTAGQGAELDDAALATLFSQLQGAPLDYRCAHGKALVRAFGAKDLDRLVHGR